MKKKLISVLLALIVCIGLAVPVFAGPAEEVLVPEESETVQNEETEIPQAEEVTALEETHEHEDGSENVLYAWDDELFNYSDGELISWTWTEEETEEGVKVLYLRVMPAEGSAMADAASTTSANGVSSCITHLGVPEKIGTTYKDMGTYHKVYDVIKVTCGSCGEIITTTRLAGEEPHSWTKKSWYQINASIHRLIYDCSCECEATTTEADPAEPHSMDKVGYTGNNYHKGTLHYLEYKYRCTVCTYTRTEYETTPCPGNNNGEGYVFFVNKVEPPDEEMSTAPGETAVPDDGESVE